MLQPADVLLLDEPTNDLDIPTLEILEESLLEFRGSLVLVTHDRYMLDRVSTIVLGLDGRGHAERFADYSQWETWQEEHDQAALTSARGNARVATMTETATSSKKKLSYLEAREYAGIEARVAAAEQVLDAKRVAAANPAISSDATSLMNAHSELDKAQGEVDELYARWAELEKKQA
jgi:ATP-binding cassette subfamily F protein uup